MIFSTGMDSKPHIDRNKLLCISGAVTQHWVVGFFRISADLLNNLTPYQFYYNYFSFWNISQKLHVILIFYFSRHGHVSWPQKNQIIYFKQNTIRTNITRLHQEQVKTTESRSSFRAFTHRHLFLSIWGLLSIPVLKLKIEWFFSTGMDSKPHIDRNKCLCWNVIEYRYIYSNSIYPSLQLPKAFWTQMLWNCLTNIFQTLMVCMPSYLKKTNRKTQMWYDCQLDNSGCTKEQMTQKLTDLYRSL